MGDTNVTQVSMPLETCSFCLPMCLPVCLHVSLCVSLRVCLSPVSAMSSPALLLRRIHQQEAEVRREVDQVVGGPHEQHAPPESIRDAPAELAVRKRLSDLVLELAYHMICTSFRLFIYCRRRGEIEYQPINRSINQSINQLSRAEDVGERERECPQGAQMKVG